MSMETRNGDNENITEHKLSIDCISGAHEAAYASEAVAYSLAASGSEEYEGADVSDSGAYSEGGEDSEVEEHLKRRQLQNHAASARFRARGKAKDNQIQDLKNFIKHLQLRNSGLVLENERLRACLKQQDSGLFTKATQVYFSFLSLWVLSHVYTLASAVRPKPH